MSYQTAIIAALTLAACDTPATPDAVETTPGETELDLSLTQGFSADDHTEVAPGVFLRTDLYEAGEIEYVPVDLGLTGDETEEDLMLAMERAAQPAQPASGVRNYCYNNDYRNYNQSINKSLFAEQPTFYGYANAYSYRYGSYETNLVYAGAYTYARDAVQYAYAYSYVYIDGRYVGYNYKYAQNSTYAYAYGSYKARCSSSRTIDATVYTRNYAYNADGSYANVGTTYELSADCCL